MCLPENYQLKVGRMCDVGVMPDSFKQVSAPSEFSETQTVNVAVLLLPHPLLASAAVCCRGLLWQDCGLCAGQAVSSATPSG